jgi:predicted ATPase/class 3 adenylate cyclase/tetratricopeptide (TPR) repeat protein
MTRQRPSGTVTFLFSDIEGSTQLWEHQPNWMEGAFARQEAIMRSAMVRHGGYVYKMIGDAFQVAFSTAREAVNAAIEAQRDLQAENWGGSEPIQLRMALHTAVVEEREDDYVGPQLNRVARLLGVGYGGQVLMTRAVHDLVIDDLPPEVTLIDLGEHRLKDLIRSEEVFQISAPGMSNHFPPLKSLSNLPNNLPLPVTSFVGREKEISEVKRLLTASRLVTLTGPGGTGKTRLALQVANELLEDYPDGVWFVELAPLADPALIPATTVGALRINTAPGLPRQQALFEYLRSRKLLIIFDNCEHLVESAAEFIEELLRDCSGLQVMATSREILGVPGEVNFRCPSLSVPDLHKLPASIDACTSEAMKLFVERATSADPTFQPSPQNIRLIAQISARLDGIPLAIELAAARMRMLSIEGIASRLDDTFRLLTGGSRTALPRQQTLRASIDWSYTLLSPQERCLFLRLSVFSGGFSLDAVENICADPTIQSSQTEPVLSEDLVLLEQEEIFDLLTQLVDKSLVQVTSDTEYEPRYRLLETIRAYARERLFESGKARFVRNRHLAYYMLLAEESQPYIRGKDQARWLDLLEIELDNMRNAMEWALSGQTAAGLRLASALRWFWHIRGYAQEGVEWIERLLAVEKTAVQSIVDQDERAKRENDVNRLLINADAMSTAGILMDLHYDVERGLPLLQESLAICQKLGKRGRLNAAVNKIYMSNSQLSMEERHRHLTEAILVLREEKDLFHLSEALMFMAHLDFDKNENEGARPYLQESLALREELQDLDGLGITYTDMASIEFRAGNYAKAAELFERAKGYFEQVKNKRLISYMQSSLGSIALIQGDYQTATYRFEEVSRLGQESRDPYAIGEGLFNQGTLAWERGDFEVAETRYQELARWANQMGSQRLVAFAHIHLANATVSLGDPQQAKKILVEGIKAYQQWSHENYDQDFTYFIAIIMGVVQLESGHPEQAAKLLSMASSSPVWNVRLMTPRQRNEFDRVVETARSLLGEAAFEAAWKAGQSLTPEEAVTLGAE